MCAPLQGWLQNQAPFPKGPGTSVLSCSVEPRLLAQLKSGMVKMVSLCLTSVFWLCVSESGWRLSSSPSPVLHSMVLHGPSIHRATESSFVEAEPFSSLLTLGFLGYFPSFFIFHCIPFLHIFCYTTLCQGQ